MRLLVDIGNRRVKWGLARAGVVEGPHAFQRPGEDPAAAFSGAWAGLEPPAAVTVCSVAAPAVLEALRDWVQREWGLEPCQLRAQERAGDLVNGYRRAGELGADRWANLLGARALLGAVDCVVVDAGTAVTVDAVRADGRHLGGAILAGLDAGRAGLRAAAPALPPVDGDPGALPATGTRAAIVGGTLVGLAGAVERVTAAVGAGLERPARLLTGGDAGILLPWLDAGWRHDGLLTLRGLNAATEDAACARLP
ncbi:MAG: type III pantothenate kinase [Halofilum sp. (in: g-proteobacteria)]|nr:type III pantothenate kinase [Halofilum sp. (in: g-proteobacteria)]